ncbi:MAG TPA: HAD-IIIC family phosphatase [Rhodopila sp.]|uniref:HAD-IIIC family phosphatase n=1 Tax=Rhodopila sp. TaxID=2480087 RepID=UPI002B95E607|nr:HAD-IIIC family phosphatase [Rhodopila sp.]HVY13649.1 HAD-IIIC family phosphatase [Rhodopila sp.]
MTELHWLPTHTDWRQRLRALPDDPVNAWDKAVALANSRLNFVLTNALDETIHTIFAEAPDNLPTKTVRLAVLGSSTLTHLLPAIRVAGLRRGIWIDTYENDYGQYLQELTDPESELHAFKPTAVLVALDAYHLAAGVTAAMDAGAADAALAEMQDRVREVWRLAREAFKCPILQQAALPVHRPAMGNNEHRLPGSRAWFVSRLNHALRTMAEQDGVDILAVDDRAAMDGVAKWHDAGLWHRSKQEVSPPVAPLYGDLVGRWVAAKQGRSFKCLVLDLDNTVWGGVVGDDGLEGIVVGQGSPLGEAYTAFQDYARELSRRGVILAVCSKNDEANALEPFEKHPDMVLKRGDIACFVANWDNKADNIRAIARELNIGIDSLVFIDDNPFERNLVRQELPMVAVPEVTDDPTDYPIALADAGYFEGLSITDEDRERTAQYQGNKAREALKASVTDLPSYLRGLEMELIWKRFDKIGLQRTVQLINKSNQFNLTTKRYTEEDIIAVMADPDAFGLQLRLTDRFGDNGIIAIIIGRLRENKDLYVDTWLMSCRVLGRQVEPTTLNLICQEAKKLGARRVVGEYIPTKKNGMVKEHYARLGFTVMETDPSGGNVNILDLGSFTPAETFIHVVEG